MQITKQDFEDIKKINRQIQYTEKQIEIIGYTQFPDKLTDSVRGSSPQFPYTEHKIVIFGIDWGHQESRMVRLKEKLIKLKIELKDKTKKAIEYIDAIQDPQLQVILQCKYINCFTWEEMEIQIGISQQSLRRKLGKWSKRILTQKIGTDVSRCEQI